MLEFLRKRAQSIVIQAIVVIIALVFIFWGVGTNLMNKQEAAIVVDNEEISFQQFQQAYDQAYTQLADQFGGTVPKGLAEQLNIKQQVISQLIQEALLRQGGQEMGLMVSSREIQNEVESMIQFQQDGRFDLERYKAILASNRLSPEKYEQSLRYELLGTKTIGSIAGFSQVASDHEIEELYNLEKESVSLSYVVFSPDQFVDSIEVTEDGLAQWYEANGESYKTEKEIQLRYLPFLYSDIGKKIVIDTDELENYYNEHLSEYQNPERRHARHILLRVAPEDTEDVRAAQRARAEEVLNRARDGEDFAQLAQEYSEGPTGPTGGDLGFFTEGQMVQPFNDAVFSMAIAQISDIVETDFGYHVIKLEDIQPSSVTEFEEAREKIEETLKLEQAKPMAFELANSAYEGIISVGSLASYIDGQPEVVVVDTELFTRSAPPEGVTSDPAFLEKAFMLNENELSSIIETADGYVIISTSAVKSPEVPELADVRDRAEQDYRAEKASEKAITAAEKIIADLGTNGASFAELAADMGVELSESGPLVKNDQAHESPFPQTLVANAFRLSASAPVSSTPGQFGADYYVYRFDQRNPPEVALTDEDREAYRQLLLQFKQQRVVDAWLTNRQADATIRIHESLDNY